LFFFMSMLAFLQNADDVGEAPVAFLQNADDVGEAPADTDKREHNLLLAIHVGVAQTQDAPGVLTGDQRLQNQPKPRVRASQRPVTAQWWAAYQW
jgi:hypothetical protein